MNSYIEIYNAYEHNLKNINIKIPRDKLIIITGLSGSGKSTLAFDTIYAEGQRRYIESLSSYARQFLGQMNKPKVEKITGLSPAIAIDQGAISKNPRSTVGTITEIYDYLRILFARVGTQRCYQCGEKITALPIDKIIEIIYKLPEETKLEILAPVVRSKKGEFKDLFEELIEKGFTRAKIDGEEVSLYDKPKLSKTIKHNISVIIDKLKLKKEARTRIVNSVEIALNIGQGLFILKINDKEEKLFSEKNICINCGISSQPLEPRIFSFNNPYGACPACKGLGYKLEFNIDLIIPDKSLSLREGAIKYLKNIDSFSFWEIDALAKEYNFSLDTPFKDLPEEIIDLILYGSGGKKFLSKYSGKNFLLEMEKEWEGIIPKLRRRYLQTTSQSMREWYESFMSATACNECKGMRLRKESIAVTLDTDENIKGKNIIEISRMSIKELSNYFKNINFTGEKKIIAEPIIKEINNRLKFLINVGLDYLTIEREARTLSGGEAQRIRLATQLGSQLMGVLYVLDEPSIGLHQKDNEKLIRTLKELKELGNTVIVVEHDENTIRAADFIIDLGPGAGANGGYVVASGTLNEILKSKESLTAKYLNGEHFIEIPEKKREPKEFLEIIGAAENNLKNINVKIPLGVLTVVTGVSGSGKSSLIYDVLYNAMLRLIYKNKTIRAGKYKEIRNYHLIDKVINIDQTPIGRTPRSNPATYTGVFNYIRDVFAQTKDAQYRGFKKSRFSFNVKGGRCEECQGAGVKLIEMHFLPDVFVTCEVCKGRRFNSETLEVKYKGKNIYDVLEMNVEEAYLLFEKIPPIKRKLQLLKDVGLDYIKLGQSATTLSGGEAQRIKLSTELSKTDTGRTLYLLDEPTTGLHFADTKKLIEVLQRLVDKGNTVIVIEHNLDVIKVADWIIDLGPEGGDEGGEVIFNGRVDDILKCSKSYTGQFLKKYLSS
ncbi:MAG TPA: excinuclease ABC subunit UvrA [bacterium]|nr:excinuclease ABC subunit UvrA [bacterium]HOL47280.1 excinuclease ABC subunit UvrA [bacterium]HPQ18692.1 excinuclease ABC subunit UvrA [bacterium]